MNYTFCNLADSPEYQLAAAEILWKAFIQKGHDAWPDLESAKQEVAECINPDYICLGICKDGELLGWVGLRPSYELTWELHPLVVRSDAQGKGIGRQLVAELERRAKERGIIGIMLGTDDELFMTSLSQVDLTPQNLPDQIKAVRNLRNHPFEFYQKCGYGIIGVIPNANGKRKPDILMWKSLID